MKKSHIDFSKPGYSGVDIHPLVDQGPVLFGYEPDSQRYFDYHHSDKDVFESVHPRELMLGAAEESLHGDGTDIHFSVGANGDINIPANIGLTFGNDGEKIEGNGTKIYASTYSK